VANGPGRLFVCAAQRTWRCGCAVAWRHRGGDREGRRAGVIGSGARGHEGRWRGWRWLVLCLVATVLLVAWRDTFGPPSVHRDTVVLAGLTQPVRLALISDIHVAGPDMTPQRLDGIVAQVNALHPDMVVITGDFISDKEWATAIYDDTSALRPLKGLRSRWGTWAVMGNHDYLRGEGSDHWAMKHANIHLLRSWAHRVGPVTLVGYDDIVTGHARPLATAAAAHVFPGPYVALSHSPQIIASLPADFHVLLAGHTHCGQIQMPFWGVLVKDPDVDWRYVCGRVDDPGRTTIVTGGLGTSGIPLRFGARPEIRLITLVPPGA